MFLFTERWCVACSRNYHQSKERVKLPVVTFSEFWLRSPTVTQVKLPRKNTQNRLSVPFNGDMVRCTFWQPPPIERADRTTGDSFLRVLIKVTQGQLSRKAPKIDLLYPFTERWCVARSRNHHQSKERVKLPVSLLSEFWLRGSTTNQSTTWHPHISYFYENWSMGYF